MITIKIMKKKFKILAASDIEGDVQATRKLANLAKKEKVDLVVLAGDLIGWHESSEILKPFMDNACCNEENANLITIFASLLGGIISCCCTNPFWVLSAHMVMQKKE